MVLAALDLNADRIWAVSGAMGQTPQVLHLDGELPELPLALSLAGKEVLVGRTALGMVRRSPHLVCKGFLPRLGEHCEWHGGRHRLGPDEASAAALRSLKPRLAGVQGVLLALPSYLSREQVGIAVKLAQQAGLPVQGAVSRSLAAALASYADHPWHHVGVIVDVDEHALTCTVVRPSETEMVVQGKRIVTALGLRVWREKLLGRIAELCIRSSRRDPRQSPDADQAVYDQLDAVLDGCSQNRPVYVKVQATEWFQALTLQPAEAAAACGTLAQQTAQEIQAALAWAERQMTNPALWFTAGAARLPGLAAAVYGRCSNRVPIAMLPPAAVAQAAFTLLERIHQGELPASFFDPVAPLPVIDRSEAPPMIPFPLPLRQTADELPS
jgi:molecular chaperone DnaK (HSP70)